MSGPEYELTEKLKGALDWLDTSDRWGVDLAHYLARKTDDLPETPEGMPSHLKPVYQKFRALKAGERWELIELYVGREEMRSSEDSW